MYNGKAGWAPAPVNTGKHVRDSQRKRLYDAEAEVIHCGQGYRTLAECRNYLDSIVGSQWFKDRWPSMPYIKLRPGTGAKSAFHTSMGWGMHSITLPLWARNEFTILHELAHALTVYTHGRNGAAAHGPEFARTFLMLTRHFMGIKQATQLAAAFLRHRVKLAPVSHVTPSNAPVKAVRAASPPPS